VATSTEYRVVGQPVPRTDSEDRVLGKAVYAPDLTLPGSLHCKILRSPYAHANITKLDTTRAEALPGVKGIVTYADLPPLDSAGGEVGGEVTLDARYLRQFLLAEDRVLFHGHPIAAVAATSLHIAEEALDLIDVEYEVLQPVTEIEEAIKPGSPIIHQELRTRSVGERGDEPTNLSVHMNLARGDLEKGYAEADTVLEREYRVGMVHQGYIEPQACSVEVDAHGRMTIYTTTQSHFSTKMQNASLLQIPQNKINVVPLEIGGGFGGKGFTVPELPTALLAMKTGRPVKTVLTRDEVFRATGPAPDAYCWIKLGAKKTGEVTAFEAKFYLDAGCLPGSALYVNNILVAGLSPYALPNFNADGYDVITNKPRSQAYRAPGLPEGAFAIETALDEMAEELSMDPIDLRIANVTEDGAPMSDGMALPVTRFKQILEQVKAHPAWTTPVPAGRGRGIAVGMRREGGGTSSATVLLNADATFRVIIGSVDLTGTRTSLGQIAAEELGVELDDISIDMGDTDSVGYTDGSWGSRVTYVTGEAVSNASADLIQQLKELAAERFKSDPANVEYADKAFTLTDNREQTVTLQELAANNIGRGAGAIVGTGVASGVRPVTSTGVQIGEVEVDPATGSVRVVKYTAFQDPGRAINPTSVEGQIQGAVAQGVGWALWENYEWSDDGIMQNANFLDYRMPTALDLPMIEAVFVGGPAPENKFGIRGVGEVPIIPPLAVIGNAFKNATGIRIREIPLNPERVFWALSQE
jgi:xanthine dehydrogenase molybdenum-binding subunit